VDCVLIFTGSDRPQQNLSAFNLKTAYVGGISMNSISFTIHRRLKVIAVNRPRIPELLRGGSNFRDSWNRFIHRLTVVHVIQLAVSQQ